MYASWTCYPRAEEQLTRGDCDTVLIIDEPRLAAWRLSTVHQLLGTNLLQANPQEKSVASSTAQKVGTARNMQHLLSTEIRTQSNTAPDAHDKRSHAQLVHNTDPVVLYPLKALPSRLLSYALHMLLS